MTVCPECQSIEFTIHGAVSLLEWKPRWWGLWGPKVPRATTVAMNCACNLCFTAFTVREHSIKPTPYQEAANALKAVMAKVASAGGQEKGQTETTSAPKPVPQARPAPDPRVRKR